MPDAVLVVDLGSVSTGAAVLVGDQARMIRDPLTGGSRWPSPWLVDGGDGSALTAFLATLRAEAGRAGPAEIPAPLASSRRQLPATLASSRRRSKTTERQAYP